MTNEGILKKAIEKAVENGYDIKPLSQKTFLMDAKIHGACFIFSHDFAKAFWGNEKEVFHQPPFKERKMLAWMGHLQFMVLEKEPLLYLKRFLDEKD